MAQPFTPEDLFLHQMVTDTDACGSTNAVAFAVTSLSREQDSSLSALWMAGQGDMPPRQLTMGTSSDNNPRWSPDGRRLGFISDRAGLNQVFALPLDGGEARQISQLPGAAVSFEWSPDGMRLLATCSLQVDPGLRGQRPAPGAPAPPQNAPQVCWKLPYKADGLGFELGREVHLFTVDVATGVATQLTDGPLDVRSARWSPDGREIAYTRTREGDQGHRTDVWTCNADGSGARQRTTRQSQALYPRWSPDGRWIVFSGTLDEGDAQERLWLVDRRSGEVRGLGSEDIEISSEADSVQFCGDDSGRVLAVVARRGVQEVVEVAVPGGEVRTLMGGERQLSKLACSKDFLYCTGESPVAPMELLRFDRAGQGERAITQLNSWWKDRTPATMERRSFVVPDGDGGTETIDGWLIRPGHAQDPAPLLLDVHGGPASYVLFGYPPVAYWPVLWSRGWSILALNAVGSASYGRAFADRLRGRWGELDLPQLLAAVRQLRQEGIADERVGIAGKSYGGFMAAWAIGHTREFRAAVAMAPVSNIETHYGTSDSGYYSDPYALAGDRTLNRETMRRLSPTQRAERAVTPTLILQGSQDERVPKCQAEELFVSMKRGANPACELVLYPGGSHKFTSQSQPSHRLDAMQRIVDWLCCWTGEALPQGVAAQTGDQAPRAAAPRAAAPQEQEDAPELVPAQRG